MSQPKTCCMFLRPVGPIPLPTPPRRCRGVGCRQWPCCWPPRCPSPRSRRPTSRWAGCGWRSSSARWPCLAGFGRRFGRRNFDPLRESIPRIPLVHFKGLVSQKSAQMSHNSTGAKRGLPLLPSFEITMAPSQSPGVFRQGATSFSVVEIWREGTQNSMAPGFVVGTEV